MIRARHRLAAYAAAGTLLLILGAAGVAQCLAPAGHPREAWLCVARDAVLARGGGFWLVLATAGLYVAAAGAWAGRDLRRTGSVAAYFSSAVRLAELALVAVGLFLLSAGLLIPTT